MMRRQRPAEKPVGLDKAARRLVARRRIAHLATADLRARPHVVPICFAVTGATLYSVIDRKPKRVAAFRLRRVRNLLKNPQAAVVVDVYSQDWSHLAWVFMEGAARLIDSGAEHTAALRLLRAKYPQYRAMHLHDRLVIAVDIAHVQLWEAPHRKAKKEKSRRRK